MRFGDRDVQVELDAERTVRLIKFVSHVYGEMQDGQVAEAGEELQSGGFASLVNILSPHHLYDLTSIILNVPREEVKEGWTLTSFVEMVGELSEKIDLPALLKNLQRVAGAFRS